MFSAFKAIRKGERRDTWIAFATLFGLIASHSVLETARDALFLAKIPATRLPWVYVAIAGVSLIVTQLQAVIGRGMSGRTALTLWTLVAAGITSSFWCFGRDLGDAGLYALYIWSGVLTTLVLVHLWSLLGDIFTVTQAKRVYGAIGAGSVLGAIAGTSAASAIARVLEAEQLVLVAATGFALTSVIPLAFRRHDAESVDRAEAAPSLLGNAQLVARQPYALRVVLLLVFAAGAVTIGDFLFKSTVAARVPEGELAQYFANVYVVLNVLSLVAQLGLVGWVVRRFDISVALSILPVLLVIGGFTMIGIGGLIGALIIKGADGSLRYSLHRTSTELLYVPLSEAARRRVKAFIDVVGQRGGQVVASVAILAAGALVLPGWAYAIALVVMAVGWVVLAVSLRSHYLEIFRRRLRRGRISMVEEFPEMDVASLETLIATLDSSNDDEVVAALGVLESEGRARLIPGLILYHPSQRVVLAALALFTKVKRTSVVPIVDRLLEHESPTVRAAAIAARSVLEPNERLLRMRLSLEDSPEVRATVMVNLIASGAVVGSDAREALDSLLEHGSIGTRRALAQAIARREATEFNDVLLRLAHHTSSDVRLAAAEAMRSVQSKEFVSVLVGFLGDERTRNVARDVLATYGQIGIDALAEALSDESLPQAVRWQLPGTIAQFEPEEAARVLLSLLPHEWDGMVRYQSIRALEAMVRRDPTMVLDTRRLGDLIDKTVSRAYRYIDRVVTLRRGVEETELRQTEGHELLATMLRDKVRHTVGRLFRLLGLVHRKENFRQIYDGIQSGQREKRASGIELIENTVAPPLRGAVVALVDDIDDEERLEAGRSWHEPLRLGYDELLERLLASSSDIVQDMTAFHIRELEMKKFVPQLQALPGYAQQRSDIALTLATLGSDVTEADQKRGD